MSDHHFIRSAFVGLCVAMFSLSSCSISDNPATPIEQVKQHEAWTQELIDSLNNAPQIKS